MESRIDSGERGQWISAVAWRPVSLPGSAVHLTNLLLVSFSRNWSPLESWRSCSPTWFSEWREGWTVEEAMRHCLNVPLRDWKTPSLCCWECWQVTAISFPSLGSAFSWRCLPRVPFPGVSPHPKTGQCGNTKAWRKLWRTISAAKLPWGLLGLGCNLITVKFPLPSSASFMPLRWRSWEHCSINFLLANICLGVTSQEIWTVTNCSAVVLLGTTQVKYWI